MKKLIFLLIIFVSIKGYCTDVPDLSLAETTGGNFNIDQAVSDITSGGFSIDITEKLKQIADMFFDVFKQDFKAVSVITVVALLSSVAENTVASFKSQNNAVFLVFFSVTALNGIKFYSKCMTTAADSVESLILFVNALYPVMLNSMAAGGGVTAAATLHPVLLVCGGFVMMLIKSVILPLVSISTALNLSNALSEDLQATKLVQFLSGAVKWIIGIVMTVFVGAVSISGAAAQVYDSVTIRTAKYAIGSFIPAVGGVISDSFDFVLNGSKIIKSSVGIAGLINILFLCIPPCIEILSVALAFGICAALIQPVCNKRITDAVSTFSNSAFTLFGLVCASACMFILCTGVLIGLR